MDQIYSILLDRNFRNVVTVKNRQHDLETLVDGPVNINDVIDGVIDLNKQGITLLRICTGNSRDGTTKIKNIEDFGYKDKEPTHPDDLILPENTVVPFKSDSWVLGEFIVKYKTGKTIPKRFLKSQNLLNKFIDDDEILKKLLVLDVEKRCNTWELSTFKEQNQCVII